MSVAALPESGAPTLALSDGPRGQPTAALWIDRLVALGTSISRFARRTAGRQLVVAISVPRRDFAAALVSCGWVMKSPAPRVAASLDTLRALRPWTPVRMVTGSEVIADYFLRLDESKDPPRVQLSEHNVWQVPKIRSIGVLDDLEASVRIPRPPVGALARFAGLEQTWDARLAASGANLAIVGTLTWLWDDLQACVTRSDGKSAVAQGNGIVRRQVAAIDTVDQLAGTCNSLGAVLLPRTKPEAPGFTRMYASANFGDQPPLPSEVRAVILDGYGAIKYVQEIEAPVVVCIIDRSVADETAAEIVVQLRNTRGELLSLRSDLGWLPPSGVEALAFTAAI